MKIILRHPGGSRGPGFKLDFKSRLKTWFPAFAGMTMLVAMTVRAEEAGSASGLTLLRNSSARASALGEAYVSVSDDITAMDFNPASLATLLSGQGSLQYERGLFEDSFSKAMVGTPFGETGAFGLSMGQYTSGKADLYDGVTQKTVTAEQDRVASLGYGFRRNAFAFGAGVKYLWSELAETYSGTAGSADLGVQYQLRPGLRLGAAGPLYQSKLRYASVEEKLPKVYRAGIGWTGSMPLATGKLPLQLLMDVPYDATDQTTALALGAETVISVLAFRVGFNSRSDVQQFSMGAGFRFMNMNLDYAFGLVSESAVNAQHKISFSFRFAGFQPPSKSQRNYQVYQLKPGETLDSIARSRSVNANDIYTLNRHQYSNPEDIQPGARILLPTVKN